MNYYLQVRMNALVQLSDDEFSIIWINAARHYSSDCEFMTEPGGVLYGMRNSRAFARAEPVEHTLTFREIDTMIKSMEMDPRPEARKLSGLLVGILMQMNEKGEEINLSLTPKTEGK